MRLHAGKCDFGHKCKICGGKALPWIVLGLTAKARRTYPNLLGPLCIRCYMRSQENPQMLSRIRWMS